VGLPKRETMSFIDYIRDTLIPKHKPSQNEVLVMEIIESLFNSKDTECITAPISGKYYITNKKLQYWVMVGDNFITITNHRFTYTMNLSVLFYDNLVKMIRDFIEKDREEFEKEVFKNELDLLNNIKKFINENG
jgi:hypothetical protein